MDTVVKTMIEDDEEDKKGLTIFGRDVSKIPCFRNSFLYGIGSGIGIGFGAFLKTSKPLLSQHIAVGSFTVITLVYWSVCRYQWSKQKFNTMLMREALKDKMLKEGTSVEKELEEKGVLQSA